MGVLDRSFVRGGSISFVTRSCQACLLYVDFVGAAYFALCPLVSLFSLQLSVFVATNTCFSQAAETFAEQFLLVPFLLLFHCSPYAALTRGCLFWASPEFTHSLWISSRTRKLIVNDAPLTFFVPEFGKRYVHLIQFPWVRTSHYCNINISYAPIVQVGIQYMRMFHHAPSYHKLDISNVCPCQTKSTEVKRARKISQTYLKSIKQLLLQKSSRKSKAKEHLQCLERSLAMWEAGDFISVLAEVQDRLKKAQNIPKRTSGDVARIFARHMFQGRVNAALKFLSEENSRVHKVTDEIIFSKTCYSRGIFTFRFCWIHPWQLLRRNRWAMYSESCTTNKRCWWSFTHGCRSIQSHSYQRQNEEWDLRQLVAVLARKLASTIVDPSTIEALVACRLIPLDKNSGIRPIAIRKVLRKIMGKAIGWSLKNDLMESTRPLKAAGGFAVELRLPSTPWDRCLKTMLPMPLFW